MPRAVALLFLVWSLFVAPAAAPGQSEHAGHAVAPPADAPAAPSPHAGHTMPAQPESPAAAAAPGGHAGHGAPSAAGPDKAGDHAAAPPTVTIGPDILRSMGVATVAATRHPLRRTIRAAGRVEIDESTLVAVTTKVEGWVEKLAADATGKPVKKGETLAAIYSPEVMAVELEYLRLLAWAESAQPPAGSSPGGADPALSLGGQDARALLDAARQRLKLYDIGEGFARTLEKTRRPARTFAVTSPVTGFVARKMAMQGARVMPGEKLFELADLSRVWVVADIYPQELPWVQPGVKAELRLAGQPKAFPATVDFIYPTLDDATRTAKVRFTLGNPDNALRPGLYAQADIAVDLGPRLAVPREAIIDTGERQVAYVEIREGVFEMRHVTTGVEAGDEAEIVSGLAQGEKVATRAAFLIDSETRLRGGAAGAGHQH